MTAGSSQEGSDDKPSLRPPGTVMRLARLGSFHPTRLSFTRTLIRRMARERWRVTCPVRKLDDNGYGTVVYQVEAPAGTVSLVCFSSYLAPEDRTDRVIAEKWDSAFALVDGVADPALIDRLRGEAPKQEAGRFTARELVLSRANKSVRLFDHVVACLAEGRQPAMSDILRVGYLMRTTAVYGNGKFGIADLEQVWRRALFALPYQAEMLTVYLIRQFSFDLVEHIARRHAPDRAAALASESKRALGIGNATGLGMAPFLVFHPRLIDAWIRARETALARVRAVVAVEPARLARFRALLDRVVCHVGQWNTDDARQMARIETLRRELCDLRARVADPGFLPRQRPWDFLVCSAEEDGSAEFSEVVNSLVMELYPDLVDELENDTGANDVEAIAPRMRLRELKELIERDYSWAIATDYRPTEARHFFWYRSAEKDEPRLGERFGEPGADRESPVGIGLMVASLHAALVALSPAALEQSVAAYMLAEPRLRGVIRRVQSLAECPYGEIRDNLLGQECLPIDLLRCKLSIFGAGKFDPKSDRWTRITLFQGAPTLDQLADPNADDWAFPCFASP